METKDLALIAILTIVFLTGLGVFLYFVFSGKLSKKPSDTPSSTTSKPSGTTTPSGTTAKPSGTTKLITAP